MADNETVSVIESVLSCPPNGQQRDVETICDCDRLERGNVMEVQRLSRESTAPKHKVLVNVDELAKILSIGRTAAWELVRKRKVKSVKIGRTRRVPLTAIDEYVKQLLEEAA